MKWNLFLGALVVSVGLCGQSKADLLDRMLGLNGYGSNCCEPTCCEAAPTCAAQPACDTGCGQDACCDTGHGHHRGRLFGGHRHGCCQGDVACGCPHWGVRTCHSGDLFCGLKGLFHHRRCCNTGCDTGCAAQPACAAPVAAAACCEPACDTGCGHHHHRCRRGCLLDIFRHRRCCNTGCDSGCDTGCAGGNCAGGAPIGEGAPMPPPPGVDGPTDAAPMPPAPMAEPQAQKRSTRRVVQASKVVRAR